MEALQLFQYKDQQLRLILRNDEPWWVGKDVCSLFGDSHYRRALARLDEDEKGVTQIDTPGGPQRMTVINEPGLYSLLFHMQPQKANSSDEVVQQRLGALRQFKRWVTHEVLPALRKTGTYSTPTATDPDEKMLMAKQRAEAMLRNAKARQAKLMRDMAAEFAEQLSPEAVQSLISEATALLTGQRLLPKPQAPKLYSATQIAGEVGVSANLIGRVAKQHQLKDAAHGTWVLDKSRYSDKQVSNYLYNEQGRQAVIEALRREERIG